MIDNLFPQGPLPINNNELTLRKYGLYPRTLTSQIRRSSLTDKEEEKEKDAKAMQKMKKPIIDKTQYRLRVKVVKASGIDNPMLHPNIENRLYRVVCCVEEGKVFCTTVTEGFNLIQWMDEGFIPLKNPYDHVFLYVEVIRLMSEFNPGPSHGRVVVGRAKIPLPKYPGVEKEGIFDLVRTSEREGLRLEGCIMIKMTLETV